MMLDTMRRLLVEIGEAERVAESSASWSFKFAVLGSQFRRAIDPHLPTLGGVIVWPEVHDDYEGPCRHYMMQLADLKANLVAVVGEKTEDSVAQEEGQGRP